MADSKKIIKHLQLLQELVKREDTLDTIIETTVSKLLAYEIEKLETQCQKLKEKLAAFEEKYGMSTEAFTQRFQEGSMGDEMDFFEWSALADIYADISRILVTAKNTNDTC